MITKDEALRLLDTYRKKEFSKIKKELFDGYKETVNIVDKEIKNSALDGGREVFIELRYIEFRHCEKICNELEKNGFSVEKCEATPYRNSGIFVSW